MVIDGFVVGDAAVTARFANFGPRLKDELRAAISKLTLKLQREVVQNKLTGQALNVRTGTLRRSIGQRVSEEGASVVGLVSTNLSYAKAHEYGFTGSVQVKEHLSRSRLGNSFTVQAHSMKMDIKERSFLRSALAEMKAAGTIEAQMAKAVSRASA